MTPRRTATATAAAALCALLATSLTGCGNEQAPAAPMPTTADTRAQDFATAEKVIRAAQADADAHKGRYTDERLMYPDTIKRQNQFFDDLAAEKKTMKGTDKIISLSPSNYMAATTLSMRVCVESTGGIYDAQGRNITVDPTGKPVDDKTPRRGIIRYTLGIAGGPSWRISGIETLPEPC